MHTVARRLVALDKLGCLNTTDLCQLHQFFVGCSVEPRLGVEAINDMQPLKEACRWAFEGTKTAPSATQQQVSETLCQMGLSVEVEARCPKSGYSIDMLVHDSTLGMGGESSSSASTWAVEFDGPDHFLASRAPTGATLLKRRHLRLLGHALVSVPYWEWSGCKGAGEREQYLKSKLAECGPVVHNARRKGRGEKVHAQGILNHFGKCAHSCQRAAGHRDDGRVHFVVDS